MNSDSLEASLRSVITAYNDKIKDLRNSRDDAIRRAADLGMRQVDIARVTGYNRETIRQIVKAAKESDDA